MVPPRASPSDDDVGLDLDDEDDTAKRTRPGRRRRLPAHVRPAPVRGWNRSGTPDDPDDPFAGVELPEEFEAKGRKRPVYWRARDSLFFEPLVALAVVAILLVSLYAYTSNWPPVYAVESNSMQHGSGDHLGYLNAGDIVLAEKLPTSQIVPYVVGKGQGFTTYGEPGDVLLYYPYGETSTTPIIHRAIVYLAWNPAKEWYNATQLSSLPCNDSGKLTSYWVTGASGSCADTDLPEATAQITLYDIGQQSLRITIVLSWSSLGGHSGFVTLGDNNSYIDQSPLGNGSARISSLVESGWIIGVARGMIPWFGAIKLAFDGEGGFVPSQSWEFLGLTVAGVIFAAVGVHYALRREGIESRLRKREEAKRRKAEPEEEEEEAARPHRFLGALRPWSADDPGEIDAREARPSRRAVSYEEARRSHFVTHRERPPSHPRHPERKRPDDDEEL
jgi:signal peptidase I